jgi:hypothetical protein
VPKEKTHYADIGYVGLTLIIVISNQTSQVENVFNAIAIKILIFFFVVGL